MKTANTLSLVIEELIDVLYELNDVYNLHRDVESKHEDFFNKDIVSAIGYAAFTVQHVSKFTENQRNYLDVIGDVFTGIEADGFVDRVDLKYAVEKVLAHCQRIELAYSPELDECSKSLLQVVIRYLQNSIFFING